MYRYRIRANPERLLLPVKKKMMKTTRLNMSGISTGHSPAQAPDGSCSRILNLRNRNGRLEPVGRHERLFELTNERRKLRCIHTVGGDSCYITTEQGKIYYEARERNGTIMHLNQPMYVGTELPVDIKAVGNTLVVLYAGTTRYFYWRDGEYIYLGTKPKFPDLSFFAKSEDEVTEEIPRYMFVQPFRRLLLTMAADDLKNYAERFMTAYYKCKSRAMEAKHFVQPVQVRFALRLYDGSTYMASAPVTLAAENVFQPDGKTYKVRMLYDGTNYAGVYETQFKLNPFSVAFHVNDIDMEEWSDIVTGIDVYVSAEMVPYNDSAIERYSFETDRSSEEHRYYWIFNTPLRPLTELHKNFKNETLYYHLCTIPVKELSNGMDYSCAMPVTVDNLVQRSVLKPDSADYMTLGAECAYIYNSRLHLANIRKTLFEGYPVSQFFAWGDDVQEEAADAYVRVSIQTTNGIASAVWSGSMPSFSTRLSAMLSYPDSRAIGMKIRLRTATKVYGGVFTLSPVENEDRAVYLDPEMKPIVLPELTEEPEWAVPQPERLEETCRNLLRVSELDNPFFFPSEQTYRISEGEIIGIATATAALSQGQYGEFPLYVFTDGGIWVLQKGEGAVCYSHVHLMNRRALPRNGVIVPIENAIIYTDENNLLLLNGTESIPLLALDDALYETDDNIMEYLIDNCGLYDTMSRWVSLRKFLDGGCVGYDYHENELWISNPDLEYSCVLNVQSGYLYQRQEIYSDFYQHGALLLCGTPSKWIFACEENKGAICQVMLLTRPVKITADAVQRWREVHWRLGGSGAADLFLSVWGSHAYEGEHGLICHDRIRGNHIYSVPVRLYAPPCKSHRLALSGMVESDFHLTAIDVLSEETENNRLR